MTDTTFQLTHVCISVLVKGLDNKHIVAIASGHQHSLAMDKEGYVWSWGHGGFGRLGHGEQKDCLAPRLVDAFTGDQRILRASKIACGANCSIGKSIDSVTLMALINIDCSSGRWSRNDATVWQIQGDGRWQCRPALDDSQTIPRTGVLVSTRHLWRQWTSVH